MKALLPLALLLGGCFVYAEERERIYPIIAERWFPGLQSDSALDAICRLPRLPPARR